MKARWSPHDIDMLRTLVAEGLSAAKIAARLGRSRNAVIGKIIREKGGVGRLANPSGTALAKAPGKPIALRRRAVMAAAIEAPQPDTVEALPLAHVPCDPMPFSRAIEQDRCLFYAGDPLSQGGPDMPVCGAARADARNTRYCAHHMVAQRERAAA